MAGGRQRSSRAEALCSWKLFLKGRSAAEITPRAVWWVRGLCSEVRGKTTAGFERNWMGSVRSHLQKNKRTRRKSLGVKLLTVHGKLQLPDHRVCTQSCFYVHHQYCFLGGSSNKGRPKLLSAFMEMLPPFWGDTLKNLNSLWGNKKTSRLTDIRQGRY